MVRQICISGKNVLVDKKCKKAVWRHEFSKPDWCRYGFMYYREEDVLKLVIPIYVSHRIFDLCMEIYSESLITYSSEEIEEFVKKIMSESIDAADKGVYGVLDKLIQLLIDQYYHEIVLIENDIDNLIKRVMKGIGSAEDIYKLYIRAMKIHRSINGLLYLVQKSGEELKHSIDEIYVMNNLSENLIDRLTNTLSLYYTVTGEKINNRVTKLTVISAIFLPLSLIAGIYGMNFYYMPELRHPLGYPIVLSVMTVIALGELIYFKIKKWI